MKPIRIKRKRTKGWKMPENTVYVGRPSKWGNPFFVGMRYQMWRDGINHNVSSKEHAYYLFDGFVNGTSDIRECISYPFVKTIKAELKGKNLACWCPLDKACHADILLKIANS